MFTADITKNEQLKPKHPSISSKRGTAEACFGQLFRYLIVKTEDHSNFCHK